MQNTHGAELFNLVYVYSTWHDYYIDQAYNVYSTRQSPTPRLLKGSKGCYTLDGKHVHIDAIRAHTCSVAESFFENLTKTPAATKPAHQRLVSTLFNLRNVDSVNYSGLYLDENCNVYSTRDKNGGHRDVVPVLQEPTIVDGRPHVRLHRGVITISGLRDIMNRREDWKAYVAKHTINKDTTVHINDLFDLSLATRAYSGYYMDQDLNVYSTKRSATPALIAGSMTKSGRYYTLNGYRVDEKLLRLQIGSYYSAWQKYLQSQKPAVAGATRVHGTPSDRVHAHDTRHGLAEKGWVIATVKGGNLVLGSEPKIHLTEASVKGELERLATKFPGDTFISLKITHEVVANGISWK